MEGEWAGTVENCMIPVVDIVTGTADPKAEAPRKLGQFKRKAALDRIQELLKAELIELSTSPWAAAVVIVIRAGKLRLAIDYRKLNAVTRKDMNRLPPMKEVLSALGGSRYFSVVDISNYFHQFPLTEQAAMRTAFLAPDGLLYQWKGMPFGLVNAPAVASRTAALILTGLNWVHCLVYIDDIIIHSETEEKHIAQVAQVLNRIGRAGLKLKLAKCEFGVREVKYLGYIASNIGLRKDPEKVRAVRDWPRPQTGSDMHSFVAFCAFYRCFIRDFSTLAEPLQVYTSKQMKEVPVDWTEPVLKAFLGLKNAICEDVTLAYPDYSEGAGRFAVRCDAYPWGIGAVLGQIDALGRFRPIEYISRLLTVTERKFHITEQEGLALVWALNKWRGYLEGMDFDVYTDHNALLALQGKKDPHGRLERWMTLLQQFMCTIKHIPGKYMVDADALSRMIPGRPEPAPEPAEELEFYNEVYDCGPAPPSLDLTYDEWVKVGRGLSKVEAKVESKREKAEVAWIESVDENSMASIFSVQVETRRGRKERARKKMEMKATEPAEDPVLLEGWREEGDDRERLIRAQQEDVGLVGKVYRYLVAKQEGTLEDSLDYDRLTLSFVSNCEIIDRVLKVVRDPFGRYGRQRRVFLTFVPVLLRGEVLGRTHRSYQRGHPQLSRLYNLMGSLYYWRGMYNDCKLTILNCVQCQRMKAYGKRREGELQVITGNYPNDLLGLDLIVMPKAVTGCKYILVIVDYFTKYTRAIPLASKKSEEVAVAIFINWLLPMGSPDRIISDQGSEFVTNMFKKITEIAGIKHSVGTPYHPQANGQVEATNKLIVKVLRFLVNRSQDNWDRVLPIAEAMVNTRQHPATLETPYFLWHLREYNLPEQVLLKNPVSAYVEASQFVNEKMEEIDEIYERARSNILKDKLDRKSYYDKVYGKNMNFDFRIGDKVWLYTPRLVEVEGKQKLAREKSKLARVWEGPFRIVQYVGKGPPYSDYMIQFTAGQKLQQIVNINRLKPYYGEDSDGEDTDEEVEVRDSFNINNEPFIENRVRYWNQPVYKERAEEDKDLEGDVYEIERLVDVRRVGRGKKKRVEFRVKWKGFNEKQNSWVREDEVKAKRLLREFKRDKMLRGEEIYFRVD